MSVGPVPELPELEASVAPPPELEDVEDPEEEPGVEPEDDPDEDPEDDVDPCWDPEEPPESPVAGGPPSDPTVVTEPLQAVATIAAAPVAQAAATPLVIESVGIMASSHLICKPGLWALRW